MQEGTSKGLYGRRVPQWVAQKSHCQLVTRSFDLAAMLCRRAQCESRVDRVAQKHSCGCPTR
eukprot:4541471-Amphidinium_carterae.1